MNEEAVEALEPAERLLRPDLSDEERLAAVKELANNDGWQVVLDEKVPYGTTDWGPILPKIRKAKPFMGQYPVNMTTFSGRRQTSASNPADWRALRVRSRRSWSMLIGLSLSLARRNKARIQAIQ